MKMIARGSLGVLMTCVAGAVGAVGAPAAAAGEHVPVALPPLEGLEYAVPVEAPALSTGLPVPVPGAPASPRYEEGRLLPAGMLAPLPVSGELAPTHAALPLPHPLSEREAGTAHVTAPVSELVAATPGGDLALPLTAPRADGFGLPDLAMPEAALISPELRGTPGATLGLH
ncbi:hypothetical protein ABZ611_23200 [Streptomyces sp. NPDC007861]|uniref:hypothetical protein n=1 Tax=Streptomyces sp. NPDC007861 TaxID=3154893 RepID=UPI0033EA01BA